MSVGQISGPRPGRDGDDGKDSSVDLWNIVSLRSDYMLLAHKGDRNGEVKPFQVGEGVSTAMLFVLFTPVFPFARGIGRWGVIRVIENESCGVEADEGENG